MILENCKEIEIKTLSPELISEIEILEHDSWPQWLKASTNTIQKRINVAPELQIGAFDSDGKLIAVHFANRVNFDPESQAFPTWDEVVGPDASFTDTYSSKGNAIFPISMSIAPSFRGKGIAPTLIKKVIEIASQDNLINYFLGHFRPVLFGKVQQETYKNTGTLITLSEYTQIRNDKGEPYDPWFRSLSRVGMVPVKEITNSMMVSIDPDLAAQLIRRSDTITVDTEKGRKYYIGETGHLVENCGGKKNSYVYKEPNLLGKINI